LSGDVCYRIVLDNEIRCTGEGFMSVSSCDAVLPPTSALSKPVLNREIEIVSVLPAKIPGRCSR
jgi:hypothetical protein